MQYRVFAISNIVCVLLALSVQHTLYAQGMPNCWCVPFDSRLVVNVDSVAIDTCGLNTTLSCTALVQDQEMNYRIWHERRYYAKKYWRVTFTQDVIHLPPLPRDSMVYVSWQAIDTNYPTLRAGLQAIEQQYGSFRLRKVFPAADTGEFSYRFQADFSQYVNAIDVMGVFNQVPLVQCYFSNEFPVNSDGFSDSTQWVAAHGEEGYEIGCFIVMQDGKLLAFHPHYVLQARDEYIGWDITGEHLNIDIDCARTNPRGEVFVGGRTGVWAYDDSRKTWEPKSEAGIVSSINILDMYIDKRGYIYASGSSLFSKGGSLWCSRDNAESWLRIGHNLKDDEVVGALDVRQDGRMYVCGSGGVYRSDDNGDTFLPIEEWGATSSIYGEDIEVHGSGVVVVGSGGEGSLAWCSDVEGDRFHSLEISSVTAITMDSVGRIYLFGRITNGLGVYRSLDTGKTWEEYNSGRTGDGVNNVYDMITTPEGYVFTGGVSIHRTKYRQHNKPVFWGRTQSCNAVEYVVMDSSVSSVQIVPAQSNNVRFEVLSPLGSSKVKIRLTLFDERIPGYFTLRALNAQGMETVYSDTLQKIFPEPVIRQSHDTLWSNGGYVYQWYRNGEKLDGERREFLQPTESGSYSVQVLNAYGCEQRSTEFAYVLTSVEEAENSMVTLEQNTPNPCDGVTIFQYKLPHRSPVCLTVSDVTGRIVGVLAEGIREAGEHTAEFDVSGLAPGVYFYRLDVDGTVISKQMTVFR